MKKNRTIRMIWKNLAFTLIEVVIGVTLMSLVMVAVAGLIITTVAASQRNVHSLQAVALAEEGLEIMRYMRDSNWLQNYGWNQGLSIWGDDLLLDFGDTKKLFLQEDASCPPCFSFAPFPEKIELDGGPIFTRSIVLNALRDESGFLLEDIVEIRSIVEWNERTLPRSIEVSSYLSNWK